MTKSPKPPESPPDPSPRALQRIEEILHRYQVPPDEADELLSHAVMEVAWRRHPDPASRDDRLVRSVERRALAWREDRLRRRLAQVAAEKNGHEAGAEIDPAAEARAEPADPPGEKTEPDADPGRGDDE